MEYDKIIPIDPGASNGGMAFWKEGSLFTGKIPAIKRTRKIRKKNKSNGELQTVTQNYSETDVAKIQQILEEQKEGYNPIVFIEKAQARHKEERPERQYAIQQMMAHYNSLVTVVKMVGLPMIEVIPLTWQKGLHLWVKGEDYDARKERFKAFATRTYAQTHPQVKVTLWNADALCLLHFARLKMQDDPNWIKKRLNIKDEVLF